jgi:uncharacterized protein YecT (DUF1311 family)
MMSIRRTSALAIALALAAGPALALDCKNASNTIELNECAQADQKAVEAKLNAAYAQTMKALGDSDHAALKQKVVVA